MAPITATELEQITALSRDFEQKSPHDVLAYAIARYYPDIVLASSFGAEDVTLIDMVHRINASTPILYLDTDFLFKETYETRDAMIRKYGIRPIQVKSLLTPEQQAAMFGDRLWERHPDECCNQRKV